MFKNRYSPIENLKVLGKASKTALGPHFDVLVWNIYKCRKKGWQDDFINITLNTDLVLLQEAILNSPFDFCFDKSLQHQWIMARSFRDLHTNFETGVKTGSTVAANTKNILPSMHSEPFSKTKKMLLATQYPLQSRRDSLLVINAHIINFVNFIKFKTHLDQISGVLTQHDGPVLLAGDFNTWNKKRLQYFNQLALSFSLSEIDLIREPRLVHLFQHLDHIYCRGLHIEETHVLTDIRSSDHFPIKLKIGIN